MENKKEKEREKKLFSTLPAEKIYLSAIILLLCLLILALYHGYNMEKNCFEVCQEKLKPYQDAIELHNIPYGEVIPNEQDIKYNWQDSYSNSNHD